MLTKEEKRRIAAKRKQRRTSILKGTVIGLAGVVTALAAYMTMAG